MQVSFVGAGPGAPDLITLRGLACLQKADVVIYAGSLVNPELLGYAKAGARIYDSAGMTLDEVLAVMEEAAGSGQYTVRLHTGDPSLYGAIREQMDGLARLGISYAVVPGVSSFVAAAATLKKEFTLPMVSQTVIITRRQGRTAVPEKEKLSELAAHGATLCIFLSVQMLPEVVAELLAGGAYRPDTPIAIVEKASWPDERVFQGTLGDILSVLQEGQPERTAMIMVGGFLGQDYEPSRLYAGDYSHLFRQAKQ